MKRTKTEKYGKFVMRMQEYFVRFKEGKYVVYRHKNKLEKFELCNEAVNFVNKRIA